MIYSVKWCLCTRH